ncbi:MAG: MgtC/SapB family protein [Hyphomonadaceae bacterium]
MSTEFVLSPLLSPIACGLAGLFCGGLIGLERQLRGHEAGLHTNALVALGAAIFVAMSRDGMGADSAARMAAQVATAVGFLCAGLIWRDSGVARGLNTAATVWCSAAIGLTAGLGQLGTAFAFAVVVVAANAILHVVGARIGPKHPAGEP